MLSKKFKVKIIDLFIYLFMVKKSTPEPGQSKN